MRKTIDTILIEPYDRVMTAYNLSENLKEFENKTTIEIEFEKSIDGKVKLEEATIKYDEKRGFINIENKDSNFKINTTFRIIRQKMKNFNSFSSKIFFWYISHSILCTSVDICHKKAKEEE